VWNRQLEIHGWKIHPLLWFLSYYNTNWKLGVRVTLYINNNCVYLNEIKMCVPWTFPRSLKYDIPNNSCLTSFWEILFIYIVTDAPNVVGYSGCIFNRKIWYECEARHVIHSPLDERYILILKCEKLRKTNIVSENVNLISDIAIRNT